MPIQKSTGVTPTEQLLFQLCERTFLNIWSYANVYKADGHELCDVIAVFENHVFLFFDRESRKFDDEEGDLTVQWYRWYKKAIEDQLRTSAGAKRYILERSEQIFLDAKRTIPFPLQVPKANVVVHSIIVAHGAAEACKRDSPNNVYGSLGTIYTETHTPETDRLFFVRLDSREPVHVLDTVNLDIVLKELDTVADFANYLAVKEKLIRKLKNVICCGEEDFLANYLTNYSVGNGGYSIRGAHDKKAFVIVEGQWSRLVASKEYRNRKKANEVSQLWDKMLRTTGEHGLEGNLLSNVSIFRGENPVMEMAKEPRLARRYLSQSFSEAIAAFYPLSTEITTRIKVAPSYYKGTMYVLLLIYSPQKKYGGLDRHERTDYLKILCGVVKNQNPHVQKVVGIAMTPVGSDIPQVNDYVMLNCKNWSKVDEDYFKKLNKHSSFLSPEKTSRSVFKTEEFPATDDFFRPSKPSRNVLCPCGSEKKYKNCCLKR